MEITAKLWDKQSPINGRDSTFLSNHFKKQNGNDDRVLISFDDTIERIEYLNDNSFNATYKAYMKNLLAEGLGHEEAIAKTWGKKVSDEYEKNETSALKEEKSIEQLKADMLYLSIMTGVEL